jgi:hypothetical protein
MKTVWKFPLTITDKQTVEIPEHFTPLSVHVQEDEIFMWAEVFTTNPKVQATINMYGTGHELPEYPGRFLGTVLTHGGKLVWHVYSERG